MSALASLTLCALCAASASFESGYQYAYKGTVSPLNRDRSTGSVEKTFDLTLVSAAADADGTHVYWHVEENGRGRWPWPDRFGKLTVSADQKASGHLPLLLYDRGEDTSMVSIALPLLERAGKKLEAGATWEAGEQQYEVLESTKLEDREVWAIRVHNRLGRHRTLWIDKTNSQVVGADQRVFMGQGEEYLLQMRLVGADKLDGTQLSSIVAGFDALEQLRSRLNRPLRREDPVLTPKQLQTLREHLPEVEKQVTAGSLVKVLKSANRDLQMQGELADTIDKLIEKMKGAEAPDFEATGIGGAKLSTSDLSGVTLLHFWSYRDTPLKEPYGQVGYLDYLYHKQREQGLKVFGVAVDARLRDEKEQAVAERSVRKLRDFMNLSYPILLDDGSLLKQFGDPRLLGAELPLWIVVVDGRIAHYRVGHYEVDRNNGLVELHDVVTEAQKAAKP